MKKIIFALLVVSVIFVLSLSVFAGDVDPNADYYEKTYVVKDGTSLALYEKDGENYYPLVWFYYEEEYIPVRFENCDTVTLAYSQGRFNSVEYNYTDKNGEAVKLTTAHAVLLNLRDGKIKEYSNGVWTGKTTPILTVETHRSHSFNNVQAIYYPLVLTNPGSYEGKSALRVADFDRNHTGKVTLTGKAYQGTSIEEFYIPSNANLGNKNGGTNSQFKFCTKLKKVEFGGNFNDWLPGYLFDSCSALEEIIIPANAVISATSSGTTINVNVFSGCNNLKRIYFLGTKAALDLTDAGASAQGNGLYQNLVRISYEEYSKLEDKSGKYIIYNCSPCLAYNNDVHTEGSHITVVGDSYLASMDLCASCVVEGCGAKFVKETIDPIFVSYGYSFTETAIGGFYSMAQFYFVNKASLEKYETATQKTIEYGVVACGNSGKTEIKPLETEGKISHAFDRKSYAYFEIKINGMTEENFDTNVIFCAYVTDGEAIVYIDNKAEYDSLAGTSYNGIK